MRGLSAAGSFYDVALAPLGYVRLFTKERGLGYGKLGDKDEQLAILAIGDDAAAPGPGCDIALSASSRHAVDAFHERALALSALDEGAPGLREHYGAGYYAAFVRDPDGYRVEAVFHEG